MIAIKPLSVRKILVFSSLAVILGALVFYFSRNESEPTNYTFVTTPLERGDLTVEINSTGSVKPVVEVLVGSQVSGYIKNLYADFESQVTKGQLIALIDPDTFKAKVEQMGDEFVNAVRQPNQKSIRYIGITLVLIGLYFFVKQLNLPWLSWLNNNVLWAVMILLAGVALLVWGIRKGKGNG